MKKNIKGIINYLTTIFSWAMFMILISCAGLLAYYYIATQISLSKGKAYEPPFSIYTIVSPSMVPKINVYDVIVNVKVNSPSEIMVGDIITFKSTSSLTPGWTITHRVVDIQIINGEYEYVTKGDNNMVEDSSPALYSNLIGRAVFKIPQLGRIQFFVASKTGWLVVVVIPALIIIFNDVLKIIKLNKVKKDADRENAKITSESNINGV